jgi:type VII secretion-associated serine protease mycosin
MRRHLRRYAIGAMAAGLIAGGTAVALPARTVSWHPAPYGLSQTPEQLLPATVSAARPVRVVSTTVDPSGRPQVSVRTATDKATAGTYVASAQRAKNAVGVEVDTPLSALGADTYADQQWALPKTRTTDAWPQSTGAGVTVAVIDTGVDAGHPDLAGQVLPGIDFVTDTQGVSTDPNGHGTHVAGIIAALTDNSLGVAAVAPDAKILPVRVLDAAGNGYASDAAAGVVYAADHGADVINLSFGSATRSGTLSAAIDYARDQGVVVVAAAGNGRAKGSPVTYPAADPGVIAVAATDSSDKIASYSSMGNYIDVAAPGSDIVSTYPAGTGYATMFGTSMAAAHVAGIAALVISHQPGLTPDEVDAAISGYAVDLGPRGRDRDFGNGRVDAAAALAGADLIAGTPAPATTSPSAGRTVAKPRPSISAVASRSAVYGTTTTTVFSVTVSGRAWASRPVQVCIASAATAFDCTDATTTGLGTIVVTQPATGSFQVLLNVIATDTSEAAASPVVSYTVGSKVTVTRTAAGTLHVVLAGVPGQAVQIQRFDKKGWVLATGYRAEADHTVSRLTAGSRYRVVVPDTADVVGMTSPAVLA